MRLSITALATTAALVWGGCLLVVGLIHLAAASYGLAFLDGVSSIYPGFHAARTTADVFVGTLYGFVDGGFGGAVFGWIYNAFLGNDPARRADSR